VSVGRWDESVTVFSYKNVLRFDVTVEEGALMEAGEAEAAV